MADPNDRGDTTLLPSSDAPDDREKLLRNANARIARIGRISRIVGSFGVLWLALYIVRLPLELVGGRRWDTTWWGSTFLFTSAAISIGMLAAMAYRKLAIRSAADVVALLSHSNDKLAIPTLINALGFAQGAMRENVVGALILRLGDLELMDRRLLEKKAMVMLVGQLSEATSDFASANYNPQLAVAILHALEATGDEDAIPAVRRLAERPQIGSPLAPVIQQARQCLDVLVARQEEERDSRVLMRSAGAPGEALLKPVDALRSTGTIDGDLLVRPLNADS